jgi:DNA-binding PadR family transcriptional regulator
VLALLAEAPMHGYQVIQEIERRSDGVWKPSPGAVYPALAQLEDEGLVEPAVLEAEGGRKVFTLTERGRTWVAEHAREVEAPWDVARGSVSSEVRDAHDALGQLGAALVQVLHTGNAEQVERAQGVLADARRALYRILAEDDRARDEA